MPFFFFQTMIIWYFWVTLILNYLNNSWKISPQPIIAKIPLKIKPVIRTQKTQSALTWKWQIWRNLFKILRQLKQGYLIFTRCALLYWKFSTPNKDHILFNIEVIRNFQIKLLSMISKIHFFNSAVVVKTVILKNSKKKKKNCWRFS